MAKFGWAYVDCSDVTDAAKGPTGSVQIHHAAGELTGSEYLMYYSASGFGYFPNSLVLSGNMIVSGTLSASIYHVEDIAIIDATGSTYFGDSNDDTHLRTGSLIVTSSNYDYILSASTATEKVHVRGFAGHYQRVAATPFTCSNKNYVIGISENGASNVRIHEAAVAGAGALMIIKDEVSTRTGGTNLIHISASSGDTIDGATYYELDGTMPAISLYSDGVDKWFVF
tara:strand:+ start:21 stop:701 length:681 start_codon:yes stop_codon:yes gene_type:complete